MYAKESEATVFPTYAKALRVADYESDMDEDGWLYVPETKGTGAIVRVLDEEEDLIGYL